MSVRYFEACAIACAIVGQFGSFACNIAPADREATYLARGKALVAKKDYRRALLEFRNAAQAQPRDAEPLYQTGLAYREQGMLVEAVEAFRRAAELNPNHAGAQLKLAELMVLSRNRGTIERARTELESLSSVSPRDAETNDALAVAELRLGQTADGAKRLEAVLAQYPSYLPSSVNLAQIRMSAKDLAGAEAVLKSAVAASPQSAAAEISLADFYLSAGQPAKAEAEIQKALSLDPYSPDALSGLGEIQTQAGRMAEAEVTYSRLAALPGPRYRSAHAVFLFATGQKDKAVSELEQLYKGYPDERPLRTQLLAAYVDTGRVGQAQALLESALKRNPKDNDALLQRGLFFLQAGKTKEAEQDLTQVLHFEPGSAMAHYAMSKIYAARGLTRTERQELLEAVQLKADFLEARVELARASLRANDPKAALELLDQAPPSQKRIAAILIERNWALLGTGASKEAENEIGSELKAVRLPDFVLQDAVVKMQRGDYAGARDDAREILKSRPGDIRAVQVLTQSYVAQKQPQKAAEELDRLSASQPDSAIIQYAHAYWYMQSGDTRASRNSLEKAKQADPKFSATAELAMVDLDLKNNDMTSARQRLNGLLTDDPEFTPARLALAALDERSGDREAAARNYRAVLTKEEGNVTALNNLAYSLAAENPDEALKLAQRAAELAPGDWMIEDTLGWVYYHKRLYGTASGLLQSSFSKQPTPENEYHLGKCFLKMGRLEEGSKHVAAALQKAPELANGR